MPKRLNRYVTKAERAAITAGYAELWDDLGVNHHLTISLGIHPRYFDPETEFMPILRNLVRKATQVMRVMPKRKSLDFTADHPDALIIAGCFEEKDEWGQLFPHWHGAVALRPGEERAFRDLLWRHIGEDGDAPLKPFELSRTHHPLVRIVGAKPTFELNPLGSAARLISYSKKHTLPDDFIHWTSHDLLPSRHA